MQSCSKPEPKLLVIKNSIAIIEVYRVKYDIFSIRIEFLMTIDLHPGPGKLRLGIMKIANKCVSIY